MRMMDKCLLFCLLTLISWRSMNLLPGDPIRLSFDRSPGLLRWISVCLHPFHWRRNFPRRVHVHDHLQQTGLRFPGQPGAIDWLANMPVLHPFAPREPGIFPVHFYTNLRHYWDGKNPDRPSQKCSLLRRADELNPYLYTSPTLWTHVGFFVCCQHWRWHSCRWHSASARLRNQY